MLIPCSSTTSLSPVQELDGERIRERVRQPFGEKYSDRIRPTPSKRAAGRIGTRVAELFGRRENPLAQLRRQLVWTVVGVRNCCG